jgi:hypothetical protein
MTKFFLPIALCFCLVTGQAQNAPLALTSSTLSSESARLWQDLVKKLMPAADAQKLVLRSLSLEVGARAQPEYPPGALLKWLEETSGKATTPTEIMEVVSDQLLVARGLLNSEAPAERRRGLRAAVSAATLVLKLEDDPLSAAVAEGFLVPNFDVADDSGPLARQKLIEPLFGRFLILDRRQFDEDGLSFAQEEAARAFWRVMVLSAPTPAEAIWPRARLAKLLLRPAAPDEDASAEKARRREAIEVLRGIAPGDGGAVFQWLVPQILESLGEKPQPRDLPSPRLGPLKASAGEVPNRVQAAYAALMERFDHGPQARAQVLAELSKLSGLTPATLGSSPATVSEWFTLSNSLSAKIAACKTRMEIYGVIYSLAYSSHLILQDPRMTNERRHAALNALWWALQYAPKRLTALGLGWDLGKGLLLHPAFDDLRGRIYGSWFYEHLEALPDTGNSTISMGTDRYAFVRGTFRFLRYAYPFWSTTFKAFEGAKRARKAQGGEDDLHYDPSLVHWAAKSRAAIDMFAVCCATEAQWHEAARGLILALEVDGRWGDAMLALSLVKYDPEKAPSNTSTWIDLDKEIRAHLVLPKTKTILRR